MARIAVTIDQNGQATFKVEGVEGPGCTDLTRALQKAVGVTVKDVKTNEYYAQATTQERRKQYQ